MGSHRSAKVISLRIVATVLHQKQALRIGFHALGNHEMTKIFPDMP